MNDSGFRLHLLGPLIGRLVAELSSPPGWWSAVAAVACLGLAWVGARWIETHVEARGPAGFAVAWVRRIAWPAMALIFVLLARVVLSRFVPVGLLSVGVALLLSSVVIRTVVLILRQTFRQARWVATFERAIGTLIWMLVALYILDLLPVLEESLESITIPLGKSRMSVMQLITGVVTVALAAVVAMWVSKAIDSKLAGAAGVDPGARVVIGRIAQPVLMTIALLIALPIVGIDLTTLSVFGGALGVGLGLGLQKIAANYISGFIILLDRSIEPGRLIRVGANRGIVSDIRTRYTVLKGMDGVDSIVPNEMLVNSLVESETFTNTTQRLALRVGIGYASDVERAMALMVQAAASQPRVLADPKPLAFLVEFADSAITLEIGFWISDPQTGTLGLRSDINLAILRAFREAGIEIPFPQREVTMKAAPPASSPSPAVDAPT